MSSRVLRVWNRGVRLNGQDLLLAIPAFLPGSSSLVFVVEILDDAHLVLLVVEQQII